MRRRVPSSSLGSSTSQVVPAGEGGGLGEGGADCLRGIILDLAPSALRLAGGPCHNFHSCHIYRPPGLRPRMSYSIVAAVQEKVYRIFLPSVAQRAHSPRRRSQAQVIITPLGALKGRSVAQIAYICAEFPHQLTPLPWAAGAPEVALELGVSSTPMSRSCLYLEDLPVAASLSKRWLWSRTSHLVVPRSHRC